MHVIHMNEIQADLQVGEIKQVLGWVETIRRAFLANGIEYVDGERLSRAGDAQVDEALAWVRWSAKTGQEVSES